MAAREWCSCTGCSCCPQPSLSRDRSVKRKLELTGAEEESHDFDGNSEAFPRVEMEEECVALREALESQRQTIQELYTELEEERDASSIAANETMSMILRLQREKAELQMEARQFKSYAEERMAHDLEELNAIEEAFCRREDEIKELMHEIEACKSRLVGFGVDLETVVDAAEENCGDVLESEYPPLRCNEPDVDEDGSNTVREQVEHIEEHIYEMEGSTKEVHMGNSPCRSGCSRQLSIDSDDGFEVHGKRVEEFPDTVDCRSDGGGDDTCDRIYTVDAVHGAGSGRSMNSPRGSTAMRGMNAEEADDIKKLYTRLQALEADRESLKQTIISMRTDSTQLELLKAIAQNLSKGVPQSTSDEDQGPEKQPAFIDTFDFASLFKWIQSFRLWKRKMSPCRYSFGLSNSNAGLLLLVNRPWSSQLGQWGCLSRRSC